jgi:hypothetical protein
MGKHVRSPRHRESVDSPDARLIEGGADTVLVGFVVTDDPDGLARLVEADESIDVRLRMVGARVPGWECGSLKGYTDLAVEVVDSRDDAAIATAYYAVLTHQCDMERRISSSTVGDGE